MDFQDARGSRGDAPETRLTGDSAQAAAGSERGQRIVLQPGAENVVVLPTGATLDHLSVQGRDIVIAMPDGRVFVIPDGAVYVPQIVIDDVAVPPLNLAALLTGNEPQPAAGTLSSSGGNFADPADPLQDAFGLGDLLPYTELSFPVAQQEEVLPQLIEEDNVPDVVIQVDGQPGSRDAVGSVDEAGLAGNRLNGNQESPGSSSGDGSDGTSGTIIITSVDGIASITINGTVVTGIAGQQIQGSAGVLTLGALDGNQISYTYALADNAAGHATTDLFTVVITDADGDVATARLTIDIIDDVPTARADTDTVPAADFSAQTGNVLTGEGTTSGASGADTEGADGAGVSGIRAGTSGEFSGVGSVAGQYGTLTISADGTYSYLRTPGTGGGVSDVFTYRIADGDGDLSTATLTIDIGDAGPSIISVPVVGDGTQVSENQLPPTTETRSGEAPGSQFVSGPESTTGTITFHSSDGISSVSLGGVVITPGALPQVVASDGTGTLTVVGYSFDPATGNGSVTYVYTLTDNTANTDGTTVSFEVVVVDADGDSATDTLDIHIVDDVPAAVSDTGSVSEGATLTVAAATGVLANDTPGADGATVTGVAAGSDTAIPLSGNVGAQIQGTYGTLTLNADGSYTYQSAANAITGAEQDVFVYTITDGDGDTSTATLTINLSDVTLIADNQTRQVDEAALDTTTSGGDLGHGTVTGSNPASSAETVTGTLAVAGASTYIAASGSTAYGVYQVNADGTYTYTLITPYTTSPSSDDGARTEAGRDSFSYGAQDASGNTVTGTITIDIRDDVPSVEVIRNSEGEIVLTTHDARTIGEASDAASSSAAFGAVFARSFTAGADGASSPTLTYDLGITDAASGLTSHGASITLYELADGTVVGSTAGTAPAGVSDASVVFSVSVAGDGTVTLTQYQQIDHPAVTDPSAAGTPFDDHLTILGEGKLTLTASTTITDGDGDTASDSETIDLGGNLRFADDGPMARADTNAVGEGASISGGVLANDAPGADGLASAPGGAVIGIASLNQGTSDTGADEAGNFVLAGAFGTLTLNRDGSYTYQSNANAITGAEQDVFEYTIADFDGDTSTATLTINLSDVTLVADNQAKSVNEAALDLAADDREGMLNDDLAPGTVEGSVPDSSGETVSGSLNVVGATGYSLIGSAAGAFGQIQINSDGTYTYTLTAAVDGDTTSPSQSGNNGSNTYTGSGVESFTYEATDARGNTVRGTITISIVDDVPAARDDSASQAAENAAFTIDVFGNDTFGADGVDTADPARVFVSSQASQGTVTYDAATGLFTYTPGAGAGSTSTSDSFEYTIVDGDGDASTATVRVTLRPDSEPEGGERVATVDDDGLTGGNPASVTGDIDANSDDAPADSSEATFTGTVDFDVGNDTPATVTFDPSLDGATATIGLETVTYSVSGNTLTATITSGARATTPLFQVEILGSQTGEYRVTLLANVRHAGGPNSEAQNAFASIDFAVTDSDGDVTTTNLGIVFNDDAPTAYGNGNAVDEGGSVGGNVLSDGTADAFGADGSGGVVSFANGANTAAAGGAIETALGFLTIASDGSYSYQSKPNSTSADTQDSFTYTIVDTDGDTSTATLTIDITATSGSVSDNDVTVDESGLGNGSQLVPGGEFDTDGQITASGGTPPYSYILTGPSNGTYGTLTLNGTTGAYSYTLDTPFTDSVSENSRNVVNGAESFGYEVYDDLGNLVGGGTISVNIVDDVPTAIDETAASISEDAAGTIGGNVLDNDTQGADGATVTSVTIGGVAHAIAAAGTTNISTTNGAYTFDAAGNWTFNPASGLNQTGGPVDASFTYTLTDGDGDTDTATQPISVTDGAGPLAGAPISLTVDDENLADGSDPNTPATKAGDIVFTPGSDAIATIAFGTDLGSLDPSLTWVRVNGTTITGSDGATLIVTLELTRASNTATITATLSDNYDTHPTINADDLKALGSVEVIATDIDGDTATSSVSLSISDDVPAAADNGNSLSEDTASVGGNVLTNDVFGADGPHATQQISAVSGTTAGVVGGSTPGTYGTLQLNLDGTYTYVLNTAAVQGLDSGEQVTDTFSYTIKDGDGDTSTAQLTVTINGANDAPLANDDTNWVLDVTSGPNPTTSGNVLQNVEHAGAPTGTFADVADTDVDVEGLTVTGVTGGTVGGSVAGSHGSIVINANGSYTYTLNSADSAVNALNVGQTLTDSFTYTVSDGTAIDTAIVTITIFGTNDAPIVTGSAVAVSEEGLIFGNPDDNPVSPAEADTTNSVTASGSITISDADVGDTHTVTLGTPTQTLYTPDGASALTWELSPDGHTLKGYSTNSANPEILVTITDGGNYTVTLGGPVRHTDTTTEDLTSFVIPVTVGDGTTITNLSNGITVTIEDDSPQAVADTDQLLEGATTSGNVLQESDVGGDSTPAWPSGAIIGISSVNLGTSDTTAGASNEFVLDGAFGTLTMYRDGTYIYKSTANSITATDQDVFEFTMVDADGDPSTATLTINVLDVTLAADNQTKQVDEAALDTTTSGSDLGHGTATGSNPGSTAETVTGTLNVTGPTGAVTYVAQSQTTAYGIFQLNTDGTYTYTLTNPYTTTPDANDGAAVKPSVESFTYTAHDLYGNAVTGTVKIDVKDDVPTATTPKATSMNNAVGVSGGNYLDDDNDVDNDYGADGGTVIFTAATITSLQGQNLTSGFAPLNYTISADGTVLTATKSTNGSTVFTISLQPVGSPDQYVVNIVQKLDSTSTIDFNAGNYNFEGGNSSWAGFVIKPEDLDGNPPTTIDNSSKDLLLTPEVNGAHASTLKTTANIGGVGGGASVGSTETFRVDFVTDLSGDPGDGSGEYEKAANRDHVFDGHYTVNGASALFKSTTNSTVTIAAYDDPDGNTVVGDGAQDTINAVVITWRGGTNSGLITTGGVHNVNGRNFTVTFNADGSVTVAGVEGDTGSSMVGTVIAVYTANGYNSVEYSHAGGQTFQIGDFGATVLTTNPVSFTVPVTIVDNDGDTASGGSLAITLNPVAPPVALDLDGDGVEYVGLDAGVAYDYGGGLVRTAWVAPDDGLLARQIDGGLDIVFTDDAPGARTDLEGLRLAYDSNGDGKFTAADSRFREFGVWNDANSNGIVDAGEFQSLLKLGITAIDLTADGSGSLGAGGDVVVHGTGQYTMRGTTYALADVSFATASAGERMAARTTEIAAVSLAAAGFMAAQTAHAQPLPPAAIEAVAAALQPFEASAPQMQVSLSEEGEASFGTAPADQAPQHQQAEAPDRAEIGASDQEGQQGLAEVAQQHFAPEPLAESDDTQSGTQEFSFGVGDSALMQALLLVTQSGQAGASDEPKTADLPAVREAIMEGADQQAVDTLIDHFAGYADAQDAAGGDTALDHALGTMLAGVGVDGLHAAGLGDAFAMAAMAAAVEAHSVAAA